MVISMEITFEVVKKAIELYATFFEDLPTFNDIVIVMEEKMNCSVPLTANERYKTHTIILEETATPRGRFFDHIETRFGVKSDCDMEE